MYIYVLSTNDDGDELMLLVCVS